MALKLSEDDIEFVKDVFEPAEITLMLTNDYYSWEREDEVSKKMGAGRLVNAVAVLMKEKSLSIDDAKEMVKALIIENEGEYVKRRTKFYEDNPSLPVRLKKWIEVAGLIVSGNNYWCVNCPRHNAWKNTPLDREEKDSPSTITPSVVETVGTKRTREPSETQSNNTSSSSDGHEIERSPAKKSKICENQSTERHKRENEISETTWRRPEDSVSHTSVILSFSR